MIVRTLSARRTGAGMGDAGMIERREQEAETGLVEDLARFERG